MLSVEESLQDRFKRALVTGGAGFIGSHLVDKLLSLGLEVISIDDFSAGKEINISHLQDIREFRSVRADVTEFDAIRPLFDGVDVVFHEACSKNTVCMKSPRRDLEVNANGTLNVLTSCKEAGVKKIVHASTGSVYGEPFLFPTNEEHPLKPVSYYGVSKLAGEKYAALFHTLYGQDVTVLRYFHVYGPRQDNSDVGGVVSIFCRQAFEDRNLVIFGDGTQVRSFTHVDDVIRINLLAAVNQEMTGKVYNCASGAKITIKDLADRVLSHYGKRALKIIFAPWKAGDIRKFDVDNTRLRNLGFIFLKDFERGLDETISWTNTFLKNRSSAESNEQNKESGFAREIG